MNSDSHAWSAFITRFLSATFTLFVVAPLLLLSACGRKGDPTLKGYEKPVTPAPFRAAHRENSIVFRWGYPASKEALISDFILLRSTGAGFEIRAHIEPDKRSFDETDFEKGREYRYKIVSRSLIGVNSDDSNILRVRPLDVPPPPSGLSFSIEGNALLLRWSPAGKGLLYNIYRSFEKGDYGDPVNSAPVSEGPFHDAFFINKTVYYTVRSLLSEGMNDEGPASEELTVDPSVLVPQAPKNIRYQTFPDRVFLTWDEPGESWVTGFRIYRRTPGEKYIKVGETQIPTFIDMDPALTKRDYRIHAVGPAREGTGTEVLGVFYTPE